MKSYTDLEQSKILSKILPLESADMVLWGKDFKSVCADIHPQEFMEGLECRKMNYIPCWSLVALLDALPNCTDIVKEEADTENEKYMCTVGVKDDIISTFGNNPVDACHEMILKLKEQNLL